jgi:hypothetical protein
MSQLEARRANGIVGVAEPANRTATYSIDRIVVKKPENGNLPVRD